MDPIIFTPRLKLTLVTKAERGSPELEWLHELHSNEKATWWSIHGRAKTIEDTEKVMKGYLPTDDEGEEDKTYRVAYAVHRMLESTTNGSTTGGEPQQQPAAHVGERPTSATTTNTEFVGLITLVSVNGGRGLALPEHLTLPAEAATTILTVELAYMFLPTGWGRGYATESLEAALAACRKARSFWSPFSKLYVRAIVNEGNPASLRVMHKTGMTEKGVYEWTGEKVFLAGEWRVRDDLHILGMHLLE